MEEKPIEDQLTSEGLGVGTVSISPEKSRARQVRRFQLLAKLRARMQRRQEARAAREDPTGTFTFMAMARYALNRAAGVEPTPARREAKRRQLIRKWARYSRDLFRNRYR